MKYSTVKEKRKMLREYIRGHPQCTSRDIKRDTKIKIERVYNGLKSAYEDANIQLPPHLMRRNIKQQKEEVITFIRNNPEVTIPQIRDKLNVNIVRVFGSIRNAYKEAGITYPNREINFGVCDPQVMRRCLTYEKEVISILKGLGTVKPKVRTFNGIIDCLFECKNRCFVVEIKDFRARNNITMSQIKQLITYMKELNFKDGLLICPKSSFPKRKNSRNLFIGSLRINILSEEDLRGRSINQFLSSISLGKSWQNMGLQNRRVEPNGNENNFP